MPKIDQSSKGVYREQILGSRIKGSTSGLDDVFSYAFVMYGRRSE